jgi:benzodiazapine receptor
MLARYSSMAVFLLLVVIAASLASSFAAGEWYFTMYKPAWTPPSWVFGPLWSVLYLLLALAMWKIWDSRHHQRSGALIWWLIVLLLNTAWSWLFFGMNRIGWSMLELTLLIGIVVLCIKVFSAGSRTAAVMMIPYLLWLIYIWFLNLSIWMINGGGVGTIMN